MFNPKYRFTHEEVRIIVLALVELKNQLIAEGRYTDPVDELMVKVRSSMSGTDIVVVLSFFKDADKTRHILRYSYGLLNRMLILESGLRLLVYDASKTGFDEYVIGDEAALMQAYAIILNKPLEVYTGSDVTEEALREYINRIYPFLESYVRLNKKSRQLSGQNYHITGRRGYVKKKEKQTDSALRRYRAVAKAGSKYSKAHLDIVAERLYGLPCCHGTDGLSSVITWYSLQCFDGKLFDTCRVIILCIIILF